MFRSGHYLEYIVQPYQLLEGMFVLLVIISFIILYVTFYLLRRGARSLKSKRLRHQFGELICHVAISDSIEECAELVNQPVYATLVSKWLKDPLARKLLVRELAGSAKNMRGQSVENLGWLYKQMGLDRDSLAYLKNKNWHVKARTMQQLANLQQTDFLVKIYRYTNDKNELVRNEARQAIVKLKGFEGLRFLEVISYPITEWEQVCLLQELSSQANVNNEALQRWLQSKNESVVEFALKLITHYQLYELYDDVVKCLGSGYPSIRGKAILLLKEIFQPGTPALLVKRFSAENSLNQRNIVEVLKEIGTAEDIPFLVSCLDHPSDEIKASAARAINNIGASGLKTIKEHVNVTEHPWVSLLPQLREEALA